MISTQSRLAFIVATISLLASSTARLQADTPASAAPPTAPAPAVIPTGPPYESADWAMSFDDEFGGDAVDLGKWRVTDGTYEQREDVRQYYSPLQVTVRDGSLFILTEQKAMGGREYRSGDLRTIGRFGQLYGKFEMRAREPRTLGAWPAFWLLPAANTWPPEIDIAEGGCAGNQLCDSNHWGSTMATHGNKWTPWTEPGFDLSDWHTYSVIWGPGTLTWYVDGKPGVAKAADEPVSAVPMFMRLNTAVGPIAGDPAQGTWPQTFQVDWVRAYRLKTSPPPVCAGPNRAIFAPENSTELDGYSCNPLGGVQLHWSKSSGPGRVKFADPRSATTTAKFDKPGKYVIRLTAQDGDLSAFDETTVLVDGSRDLDRPAMQCAVPTVAPVVSPPVGPPGSSAPANLTALEMTIHAAPKSATGALPGSRLYLKFDVSRAAAAKSAHLRFMAGIAPDGTADSVTLGVYAVEDAEWQEAELTAVNAPAVGDLIGTVVITPDIWRGLDDWHVIDIGGYIKKAIRSGHEFESLCIAPIDATRDCDVTFKTRMATGLEPTVVLSGSRNEEVSAKGSRHWTLMFDDEFDGTSVDASKWELSTRTDGTKWPVVYSPTSAVVAGRELTLTTNRNADHSFTCAELTTKNHFAQQYGRFEIEARIGGTPGSWSMADLLPAAGGWPPGIDLFSHIGRMPDNVGFTNTWADNYGNRFDYWLLGHRGFDPAKWHVYALEWTPTALRWFVDGGLIHTKIDEPFPAGPMFIKLATMAGGDYPGDPTAGTWPQKYEVGFVRVFRSAVDKRGL